MSLHEVLKHMPNICGGGCLVAVVYCCAHGECMLRDYALRLLGISKSRYFEVKNRLGVRHDGVCFRNLAYCCSPEKPCSRRDKALRDLGMTVDDYVKMKVEILQELMKYAKVSLDEALRRKVLYGYLGIIELEDGRQYTISGLVSPDLGWGEITAVREVRQGDNMPRLVRTGGRWVTVYIPKDAADLINANSHEIDSLSSLITQCIREKLCKR